MGMEKEKQKEQKLKELKKKLKECQKLKDDYLAGWQRARADFLNYKKGELKRMSEILKYANESLVLEILPILDNFEVASKRLPENLKKDENTKGVLQIKKQIQDFLKSQGLEEIKSLGEKFDPNFQEVVGEAEKEGAEPGIVLEEVRKGYNLHGKVLRSARVKISK